MENNDSRMNAGASRQRPRFVPNRERRVINRRDDSNYQRSDYKSAEHRTVSFRPAEHRQGDNNYRPNNQHRDSYSQRGNDRYSAGRHDRPRFQSDGNYAAHDSVPTRSFRPQNNRNNSVYTKRKQQAYRREDPTKPMRLNKYLANAGICSRREADDFIQAGVVTVNGEVVTTLGAKVMPTDKVMFHDQPIRRERKVYILLNKPKNCVTTTDDPQERTTVMDIVGNACAERVYPVGRLDRNTTGVLLLTNDGDLAAKLTHPKYGKRKIYAVTLDRDLEQEDFAAIMQGVTLDDEKIIPDDLTYTKDDHRHLGIEIHSGQNRVVRRIFDKVGYKVIALDRVSFAGLTKKGLARGKYRFLTPSEVGYLQMGSFGK